MDLLKRLDAALAMGLSKEEFFQLMETEVKLNEFKQEDSPSISGDCIPTVSGTTSGGACPTVSEALHKCLHDIDTNVQNQIKEQILQQFQQLQQQMQQHQQHMLQQQQQQFQNLQRQFQQNQQQALQQLQKQQQQHEQCVRQLQQQVQELQHVTQQQQQNHEQVQQQETESRVVTAELANQVHNLEETSTHLKEDIQEMRNTVLKQLEEGKLYMKDELNKTQNELRLDVLTVSVSVGQIKERVDQADLSGVGNKISRLFERSEEQHLKEQENPQPSVEDVLKLQLKEVFDNLDVVQQQMQQVQTRTVHAVRTVVTDCLLNLQSDVNQNVEETAQKLQEILTEVESNILAVTDRETQILKDYLSSQGISTHARRHYVCDFYIKAFADLVKSGKDYFSLPWYIEKFHSCMKACATFLTSGEMEIWFLYARKPRMLGLIPQSGRSAIVKASILGVKEGVEDIVISEKTHSFDEEEIRYGFKDWGWEIKTVNCEEIIEKGYCMGDDARGLHLRFEITVQ